MKIYFFLAALLLAIFLLYSFFPRFQQPLTEAQAKAFLAQDLESSDWRILNSGKSGETWEFEVLVVQNAHSPCPSAEKRFYKLPPVSFRPEPFINSCYERDKIFFREEALINSAKKLGLSDGYGCAFKAGANWFEEKAYCPALDESAIASFASDLPPDAWVAVWNLGGDTKYLAIDEDNNVLKAS
ncbi:MAG: hypothetical protein QXR53_00205 [Candidatus Norongarragalinales archaeon]